MADNSPNSLLDKIAAFSKILTADPHSTIFVSLSESYRKMGMLEDAYSVAIKGLEYLPDCCPGHVVLARITCQQGDLSASKTYFENALKIDPDSLAALVGFSRLCLLQEQTSKAQQLLLRARNFSPADPVINKLLLNLSASEIEVSPEPSSAPSPEPSPEPSPANEYPDTVVEPSIGKTSEPLESVTLAELYLKQGMADKANEIFRNLLAQDPDNLELRRRIRQLETTAPALDNTPSSISDRSVTDEVSETTEKETEPKNVMSPPPDYKGGQDTSGEGMSVVDQLNQLLTLIQKRRGNV